MKNLNTTIATVDEVIAEGKYTWNKDANDCPFHGVITGYYMGLCVEVLKADGTYGYSSVTFVLARDIKDIQLTIAETPDEWYALNEVSSMADMCLHNGNTLTGRLVFRGYYDAEFDYDEREDYYIDRSKEVCELWDRYVS